MLFPLGTDTCGPGHLSLRLLEVDVDSQLPSPAPEWPPQILAPESEPRAGARREHCPEARLSGWPDHGNDWEMGFSFSGGIGAAFHQDPEDN